MNYGEIVDKLIGDVTPIGKAEIDDIRFENLKEMCHLADYLIARIRNVGEKIEAPEYSVKRSATFASEFLNSIQQQLTFPYGE